MSMSPASILARLDELKRWQQTQQEKLMKQHVKRLQQVENSHTNPSDFATVSELSALNLDKSDKMPVKSTHDEVKLSPSGPFNQLPQETLQNEPEPQVVESCKPKRAFLKRGTGLTRFKMNPGDQYKYKNSVKQLPTHEKQPEVCESNVQKSILRVSANPITPLKRPEVTMQPKAAWTCVANNQEDEIRKEIADFGISKTTSYTTQSKFAENLIAQINELALGGNQREDTTSDYSDDDSSDVPSEPNHEIVDIQNHEDTAAGEQTLYERAIEKELRIFEDLEQRVLNSSFCSTNSSVVRLMASTPQKKGVKPESLPTQTNDCNSVIECEAETPHRFGVVTSDAYQNIRQSFLGHNKELDLRAFIQANLHKLPLNHISEQNEQEHSSNVSLNSSVTSEDLQKTLKPSFNDEDAWSDASSSNTSLKSEAISASTSVTYKKPSNSVAMQTENVKFDKCSCEETFANKLRKLDEEIESFREENAKIRNMKRELEEEQRELKKDRKKLEKEVQEERMQIEFSLEEDKKKLAKDKMVFDRYVKESQNKPSKKERQEITALKLEVESLKETLKLKETRNATTQARLRNQTKSLEKENSHLKDEVDKLSKMNAKLTVSQKLSRKPSDTKMLHEISKNLTKLTKDAKPTTKKPKRISIETVSSSEDSEDDSLDEEPPKCKTKETKKRTSGSKEAISPSANELFEPRIIAKENAEISSRRSSNHSENESYGQLNVNTPISLRKRRSFESEDRSKENDKNYTNMESSFKNLNDVSLERNYDKMFNQFEAPQKLDNNSLNETQKSGKVERILADGTTEVKYGNGNVKTVSANGNFITVKYFNGDIKETRLLDGVIKYFHAENKTWHTTYADGSELLEFADGQTEKKFPDGSLEVHFHSGLIRHIEKSGAEKVTYPDGTVVTSNSNGDKIMHLPNGQKEIHTTEHKRREYPDGTVKILYPDGLQETRYSNGRIRLKDKNGQLLMDSHEEET